MSQPVAPTRLYQLRELAIAQAFQMLKGAPATDREGNVIIMPDGSPLMLAPTPAAMNVIRQLLKDNGVDREPTEAPKGRELTHFIPEDDQEPTLLE